MFTMQYLSNLKARAIVLALVLMTAAPAASAEPLDKIFKRLSGTLGEAASFAQVFFLVSGIFFIGFGIFGFIQDAKKQGNGPVSKGAAATMLIGGAVLAYVGSMITTAGDTVWGEGGGDRTKIQIPK